MTIPLTVAHQHTLIGFKPPISGNASGTAVAKLNLMLVSKPAQEPV